MEWRLDLIHWIANAAGGFGDAAERKPAIVTQDGGSEAWSIHDRGPVRAWQGAERVRDSMSALTGNYTFGRSRRQRLTRPRRKEDRRYG
jgi:hypothetical protein